MNPKAMEELQRAVWQSEKLIDLLEKDPHQLNRSLKGEIFEAYRNEVKEEVRQTKGVIEKLKRIG
ncbi:hypothetical protein [Anaerolactibacter massiliensis]|uniref:hypothetical protein n=1 Tax=Anaerolactibacter massiliensis TaxID=2044573 RepID=UPI000CF901E4|nr:hypothetical protein [Anaerolactibacter massiliensis]